MNLSEVAIVTLNWKQPQATIKCVRSILNAGADPSQIFIIDNGSRDGSLEEFKSSLPEVRVISLKDNFGFGGGFNAGIKQISQKFKFYLLTNNDIVFTEDSLTELIKATTRKGANNIYHPVITMPGTKDRILSGGMLTPIPTPFQLMKWSGRRASRKMSIEEVPYLSGCCFLVSKKLFDDLNGIKEDFFLYSEDVDFGLRAQKLGAKIFTVPGSKIYHFFQGSSGWFSPLSRYYIARNVPRIIKEHGRFKAVDFFRFFFWGFISLVLMFFTFRWKAIWAYLKGTVDFFKGKTGKSGLDF
jgi:GT2 family glycosyltransferase